MQFIDRIIANSKPFRDLEDRLDHDIYDVFHDHEKLLLDEYSKKVDKLVELTERVHNTILSAKHR